jgi:hypothetical protein
MFVLRYHKYIMVAARPSRKPVKTKKNMTAIRQKTCNADERSFLFPVAGVIYYNSRPSTKYRRCLSEEAYDGF